MPVIFKIKNKKKFFSYNEVLNIYSIIELIPNISQYSYDNEVENSNFFNAKLSEFNSLWLGVESKSTLGFLVKYDSKTNEYVVDLSYYATETDWLLTLQYLSALSEKIGNPIQVDKSKFNSKEILDYDYKPIMAIGLQHLFERLRDDEVYLNGIKRPIIMGQKIRMLLSNTESRIERFDDFIYYTQYPSVYEHRQTFHYNNDGKTIYGNYSIGENLKCVLPTSPFIEFKNERVLVGHPFTHWTMTVTMLNNFGERELYKVCEYDSFIKNISKNKYEMLDDNFIIIDKLTREELEEIIEKSIVLDNFGQFLE